MSEGRTDFELLQAFARQGDQPAFATLTRRHLDLVYATALRKVTDGGAAQEIAQNVFAVLARKAWQFAPDDSLPSWLHRTTLLESKSWLRGELRRRRREQTAAELGTTMNTSEAEPAFAALVPLLDEALLSLREKDRTALLLRFYESHSLRDVGTAVGVSEDAARMRVQSALEKVADFFKRRGFKTASVAAAAAALQHTAATTSAAVASAVVSGALQAAPPALAGLSLLLARLVSLSRVQTAAVCVAFAAVPVGLQLNERLTAGDEVRQLQTQLLASQQEGANLDTELERLRVTSGRLEQSLAQANEAAARAATDAQAFADWKQKTRRQAMARDYGWDDNSPFVRIPKAILPQLSAQSSAEPFSPPGFMNPYAQELLGMTPSERQVMATTLQRHFANVEGELASRIQETNKPLSGREVANRVFELQPKTESAVSNRMDQVLAEVRGILGEERWPLLEARLPASGRITSSYSLTTVLEQSNQRLEVWVESDDKGTPTMGCMLQGTIAHRENGALSMFLPEDDSNRTAGADAFLSDLVRMGAVSDLLRQRAARWLQEQAIARLGKKEKP